MTSVVSSFLAGTFNFDTENRVGRTMRINQGAAVDVIKEPVSAPNGASEQSTGTNISAGRLVSHPRDVTLLNEALEVLRSLPDVDVAEECGGSGMDGLALADCILRAHRRGSGAC